MDDKQCLSWLIVMLIKYESEYHFLFSILYRMSVNKEKDLEKVYSVPNVARKFLESVASGESASPLVEVLGPIPALMEKRAGRFRQLLLLTSNNRRALHAKLSSLVSFAESHPLTRKVRWAVDVDPNDLF